MTSSFEQHSERIVTGSRANHHHDQPCFFEHMMQAATELLVEILLGVDPGIWFQVHYYVRNKANKHLPLPAIASVLEGLCLFLD